MTDHFELLEKADLFRTLVMEREGSALIVNGRKLQPGERYTERSLLSPSIFSEDYVELENAGLAVICDREDKLPRLLVVGETGERLSLIKLPFFFTTLGAIFLQLGVRRRRLNRASAAGERTETTPS